jgi:hypothetical protein
MNESDHRSPSRPLVALALMALCASSLASCVAAPESTDEGDDESAIGESEQAVGYGLALNGGFETPEAGIPLYSGFIDHGNAVNGWFAGWATAAQSWPATSNDLNWGTVTTWLTSHRYPMAPTTARYSLLVAAGTSNGGISQVYYQSPTPSPLYQRVTAQLKVLSGNVLVGIGNSSSPAPVKWAYGQSAINPNTNPGGPAWETVQVCAPTGVSANQILFYSAGGAPAVFYIDEVSVLQTTPAICP